MSTFIPTFKPTPFLTVAHVVGDVGVVHLGEGLWDEDVDVLAQKLLLVVAQHVTRGLKQGLGFRDWVFLFTWQVTRARAQGISCRAV